MKYLIRKNLGVIPVLKNELKRKELLKKHEGELKNEVSFKKWRT